MCSPSLDDIYDACGRLDDAKDDKNVDDYMLFLHGARSEDAKVKKLSAQMIVRHWKNFTEQRNRAFYSLVSILEDRDPETRKAVIRELSQLVKTGELVDKIADVLSQMLQQTDDPQEMAILTTTLTQFLKSYPADVLSAVFVNISKSEDECVRIRLLKFISEHMAQVPSKLMTAQLKTLIEEQFREIIKDVTPSELDLIFGVMRSMEAYQSVQGRVKLYNILLAQINIESPFPADDKQRLDQVLYLVERAQSLLSPNCRSSDLMHYLVTKGLVMFNHLEPLLQNRFMRALAQLAPFASTLEHSSVDLLFNYLISIIPPMPSELDTSYEVESQLRLSQLEAVAVTLYALFKANPAQFTWFQLHKDGFCHWPKRLVYLAGLLQKYLSVTNGELNELKALSVEQRDTAKMQYTEEALLMARNTLHLIKDLLHAHPKFLVVVCPSWNNMSTSKRKTNTPQDTASKRDRKAQNIYVAPRGKFSGGVSGFAARRF